jgi:Na+/H+ antiporter NhaA
MAAMTRTSASSLRGRTAWARNLGAPLRDFLKTETGGAVVLLAATVAALAWANSPWSDSYASVWGTQLSIRLGDAVIAMDLRDWVNEGLMTFFFLVVGLEAKREVELGQLRERRRLAALAVMSVVAAASAVGLYLVFNAGGAGAQGWGAAMSTDTAFVLGVLALVAPNGTRLRVRLLTMAVVDDLVALVVIATVYTEHVSLAPLAVAAGLFAALVALRYAPLAWRAPAAIVLGVAVWIAVRESGIDPVISGLAVGLATGAYPPARADLEEVTRLTRSFREQPTPSLARSAQLGVASAISPNERLQYWLHPWTSFAIVPLFALANVGIHIDGRLLSSAIHSPITLGIAAGYVVGKPLGTLVGAALVTRTVLRGIGRGLSWPVIAGAGVVNGIGFTVSLLISSIAFRGQSLEEAKLGVLAAALIATADAWAAFRIIQRLPPDVRARQISHTADDLVDLSDDVDPNRDRVRGGDGAGAAVTLVEYGDYECPYCGQAEVVIRELLASFGEDLRYVWRYLPLNDVHAHTQMAAEAAEAAAAQGAFWPMHDKLLDHQDALTPLDLRRYATELGLDTDRFWDDIHRHRHANRIIEDVASADASGVAGTPSFFINGKRYEGAYDLATLTAAVRAARTRAAAARLREPPVPA